MTQQIIYGIHPINSIIKTSPDRIKVLHIQRNRKDQRIQPIITFAEKQHIQIHYVSSQSLDELTEHQTHQGIVAEIVSEQIVGDENQLEFFLEEMTSPAFLLILDGVQDPHNLGACFRTADAAGVHAIITPKDNAVGITPIVRKVASGAVETVPFFQVTNLVRVLKKLQARAIWVAGATEEGDTLYHQVDYTGPIAIVMGAEGQGLRRLTKEHCDYLIHIPMLGIVSSLNVSVATGICLFEGAKQRAKMST